MSLEDSSKLIRSAMEKGIFIQDSHPNEAPEGAEYYFEETEDERQESEDVTENGDRDGLRASHLIHREGDKNYVDPDAWAMETRPIR
jgi:hypothetical protein